MGAEQAKHDKETVWTERQQYMRMSPNSKRRHYFCQSRYIPTDHIVTWKQYCIETLESETLVKKPIHSVDEEINYKVALLEADITRCEVDGIVNYVYQGKERTPESVGRDIILRAGELYHDECIYKGVPSPGSANVVGGYKLPARYVISTTIPNETSDNVIEQCYANSLEAAVGHGMRTVAFPCLSTKRFKGFTKELVTNEALNSVRNWLNKNKDKVDMIIFCVLTAGDATLYERLMLLYFPVVNHEDLSSSSQGTLTSLEGNEAVSNDAIRLSDHNMASNVSDSPLALWQLNTRRQYHYQFITVIRSDSQSLLKQLMAIYDNPTIDLRKRPFFKFAEEEGLDMGALSKDYFYNALETLIQFQVGLAPAFEGQSDRRLPCASKAHSYDRVYEMTGKLLAHSVLHGGIGLIGASPVLAFLLSHPVSKTEVDISGIPMDMNDLPDLELRGLFEKTDILNTLEDSEQEMVRQELLMAMERCNVGYHSITPTTIPVIQQEILLYQVVYKRWDQIEQLRAGMDILSLYAFLCKNPTDSNMRKVFPQSEDVTITPERIKPKLLVSGVDRTLFEYFLTFLDDLYAGNIAKLTLKDLLAFWTGTPTLTSDHLRLAPADENQLPVAHCCFCQLQLPRVSSYQQLRDKFTFALMEGSRGFYME